MSPQRQELLARREQLRQDLKEAQAALPAHSVRPWQLQRVEDAEEALAEAEAELKRLG